jgi:hypothetical protein
VSNVVGQWPEVLCDYCPQARWVLRDTAGWDDYAVDRWEREIASAVLRGGRGVAAVEGGEIARAVVYAAERGWIIAGAEPTPVLVADWVLRRRAGLRDAEAQAAALSRLATLRQRLPGLTPAQRWTELCAASGLPGIESLEAEAQRLPGGVDRGASVSAQCISEWLDRHRETHAVGVGYRRVLRGERLLATDEWEAADGEWHPLGALAVDHDGHARLCAGYRTRSVRRAVTQSLGGQQ